ncbi:MAG: YicC family protein [Verrucomicrobia bacterium]|jgi:uncharacterized protein (TIGR00255 family)|nr:YicC family protein [Verrucomicrobiota bacterium]
MAILSMTGYGGGEASAGGVTVTVELSSVNRKQFDMRVNLPRSLMALESQASKLVHERVSRGCVTGSVRVSVEGKARTGGIRVDMDAATAYVKALRGAGKHLGLADDLTLASLARLPDVVKSEDMAEDSQKVWPVLKRALQAALRQLVAMRAQEGAVLEKDLTRRFAKLEKRVTQIQKVAPSVPKHHREALLARIAKAELTVALSEDQLAKEVALFADRCDVTEELVRLGSHFAQVEKLMQSKAPSGRAFDFLCQEFLREINTIGSKANDARLSRHVIAFKTELECVREQIQNIE